MVKDEDEERQIVGFWLGMGILDLGLVRGERRSLGRILGGER
jgi:hypothetical protein